MGLDFMTVERANKLLVYLENTDDEIWMEALKNACREILRLNEVINKLNATVKAEVLECISESGMFRNDDNKLLCGGCGSPMQPVRPGKWQCPECE